MIESKSDACRDILHSCLPCNVKFVLQLSCDNVGLLYTTYNFSIQCWLFDIQVKNSTFDNVLRMKFNVESSNFPVQLLSRVHKMSLYVVYYASINSSCVRPPPTPHIRLAFFFLWMAIFRGPGHLACLISGEGNEGRGQ